RLELDEGLVLELRGPTLLRGIEQLPASAGPGARRVLVEEGTVSIEGTGGRALAGITFVTPQAEVTVRARKALLVVAAEATKIDVDEGSASVRRTQDGRSV